MAVSSGPSLNEQQLDLRRFDAAAIDPVWWLNSTARDRGVAGQAAIAEGDGTRS
jgi:hypothetical protein